MNLHDVVARLSEDPAQIVVVSSKHGLLAQLLGVSALLRYMMRMGCLLFWNWRSLLGARRLTLLVTAGEPSSCNKWNADVISSPVRAGMKLCTSLSVLFLRESLLVARVILTDRCKFFDVSGSGLLQVFSLLSAGL